MDTPTYDDFATLDDLDPDGALAPCPEELEGRVRKLRTVRLGRLRPEDVYVLVRAGSSLDAAMPVALATLVEEPFVHAAEYPGDLLTAVLECDPNFWRGHPDWWEFTAESILTPAIETILAAQADRAPEELPVPPPVGDALMEAIVHFRSLHA